MITGFVPLAGMVMGAVKTPPAPCGSADDDVEDAAANELELLREFDDVLVDEPVLLEVDAVDKSRLLWELDDIGFDDPVSSEDFVDELVDELNGETFVEVGFTRDVEGLVVFAELVLVEFPKARDVDRLLEEVPSALEVPPELVLEMETGFALLAIGR